MPGTNRLFQSLLLFISSTVSNAGYNNSRNYEPQSLKLNVCADSVVTVTYMSVLCDSPYTFYYGNGANRNSVVCDYGDKATLRVRFTVLDDLQEDDTEIFVTMAAFGNTSDLLIRTNPV